MTSFVESKCQILKSLAVAAIATMISPAAFGVVGSSKIAWEDFPTRGRELPAQTPVSFVVRTRCAAQKLRYLRPGGMLNSVLEQGARYAGKIEEHTVGVELNSSVSFDDIEREVAGEDCVEMAGYDGEVEIAQVFGGGTDPGRPRQTYLNYIRHDAGVKVLDPYLMIRKPVTIAVIDAGVDLSHKDFAGGLWQNDREIAGNNRDDDGNGYIDDVHGYNFPSRIGNPAPQVDGMVGVHGTHVAGLAAARWKNSVGIRGVDGFAKIMALNVFGKNRTTRSSIVENAVRYAALERADVINLSLSGGEYSRTMVTALRYATSRGSFVVSAAGNAGLKFQSSPKLGVYFSPAAYGTQVNGMVTVASSDSDLGSLSKFSNYNSTIVQIAAPGALRSFGTPVGLYSTFPKNGFGTLAGTSMSAPLVSGAAALIAHYLKACGQLSTPSRIESILIAGSRVNPKLLAYVKGGRELDIATLANYLRTVKGGNCH